MSITHILVAEDDPHIRDGLMTTLESEGYRVTSVADGAEALRRFENGHFDLVLLDVMMPAVNGFDVCRSIRRANRTVPVMMLTAKGEEVDKVVGLELGADDYITKPFGVRELLARIAAALRRANTNRENDAADDPPPALPDSFSFGLATIDRKKMRGSRGKQSFDITTRELKLIELFVTHPDEALSRDALLNGAWGVNYLGTTRTLDQHIVQLRKKVEKDPANPLTILTVHGIGYRYQPAKP